MSLRMYYVALFFIYLPLVGLCLAALEAWGPRFLAWWLSKFTRRRGNIRRPARLLTIRRAR